MPKISEKSFHFSSGHNTEPGGHLSEDAACCSCGPENFRPSEFNQAQEQMNTKDDTMTMMSLMNRMLNRISYYIRGLPAEAKCLENLVQESPYPPQFIAHLRRPAVPSTGFASGAFLFNGR